MARDKKDSATRDGDGKHFSRNQKEKKNPSVLLNVAGDS